MCSKFDLPENVRLVGKFDKCDLEFKVTTWADHLWMASHYYVDIQVPYNSYGCLDLSDFERLHLRTARLQSVASFVRRVLRVIVHRNKRAILRRKEQRLFVRVNYKDTRMRLAKLYASRPLDGD